MGQLSRLKQIGRLSPVEQRYLRLPKPSKLRPHAQGNFWGTRRRGVSSDFG